MAGKLTIYIAASLNNRIATVDGSVEWLDTIPHPKGVDYGYYKFYETIDTTIMGYSTYAQVKGWDIPFPYKDKKNYVITTNKKLQDTENVKFISTDYIKFLRDIKEQKGKDIWLVGGGKVNTFLLNEGLIDEIHIFIMPIILPDGIEVFEGFPIESQLKLTHSKSHETGVLEMIYKINL